MSNKGLQTLGLVAAILLVGLQGPVSSKGPLCWFATTQCKKAECFKKPSSQGGWAYAFEYRCCTKNNCAGWVPYFGSSKRDCMSRFKEYCETYE